VRSSSFVVRCLDSSNLGLLLRDTLSKESVVLGLLLFLVLYSSAFQRPQVTAALKTDWGDKSLDFGSLGVRLGTLLLRCNFPPHDILPHIVLLRQVEELPDLRRPLGTQPLREHSVSESRDLGRALLDDDQRKHSDVWANDATTDGLAFALTSTTSAVARMTVGEEKTDTVGQEDTLLHRESLLVIATGDSENVVFPFVTNGVSRYLLRDFFVEENAISFFIVDINKFLGPRCGVGNIHLHAGRK